MCCASAALPPFPKRRIARPALSVRISRLAIASIAPDCRWRRSSLTKALSESESSIRFLKSMVPDPAEDLRGRQPLDERSELHAARILPPHHDLSPVVLALDEDVGLHRADQPRGGVLVEEHDVIHRFERGEHAGAVALREDRPALALQRADGAVG